MRALFGYLALRLEVDRLFVQHTLAAIQVLDEFADAALVHELRHLFRIRALVRQRDLEALVQKRQFAQPLRQRVVVEHRRFHDRHVGLERHPRAGLLARLARLHQGSLGSAAGIFLLPGITLAPDLQFQAFRERIDAAHAHPVETARNFVTVGIELPAGMQLGHHHLRRRHAFFFVDAHRDSASIVDHRNGVIVVDDYRDFRGKAAQSFIYRVIDYFIHQVVETHLARRADIHRRTQPHRLQPFEHFNAALVVNVSPTGIDFLVCHNFLLV